LGKRKNLGKDYLSRLVLGVFFYILIISNTLGSLTLLEIIRKSDADILQSSTFAFFGFLGIWVLSRYLSRVIFYVPAKLQKDVEKLLEQGIILDGKIVHSQINSPFERILTYEFINNEGKTLSNNYILRDFFRKIPKDVKVLYASEANHILL
jgi:hypothetical protein